MKFGKSKKTSKNVAEKHSSGVKETLEKIALPKKKDSTQEYAKSGSKRKSGNQKQECSNNLTSKKNQKQEYSKTNNKSKKNK